MPSAIARAFPVLAVCAALCGQAEPAPLEPAPVLDTSTFAAHWHHVVPGADELKWREIPWLGTLGEAVVRAQAEDKPVLLWAMNGHPLACT